MFSKSVAISTLGFPRIGPRRELKTALEDFWSGKSDAQALHGEAAKLRAGRWALQQKLGVTHIPSNDFSLYDHVLDTSVMVGAIPQIYGWNGGEISLGTYFAMARGTHDTARDDDCTGHGSHSQSLPALEMTKWFDTNYHYMVPEFAQRQAFTLASTKPVDEFLEAKALGFHTRPVLLGPLTYLKLGKSKDETLDPLSLLPALLPVYVEILQRLARDGADWVQLDEPALVLDLDDRCRQAYEAAYATLSSAGSGLKLLLTTYFGAIGDNLETALRLPVAGLHLDLVRGPAQVDDVLAKAPADLALSLGIVDGRNVWRTDLDAVLDRLEPILAKRRGQIMLAPSCSLLHVPIDLAAEKELDPELKTWLAFAVQKIDELATLGKALSEGRSAVKDALAGSARAVAARKISPKIHDPSVQKRISAANADMTRRRSGFAERQQIQRRHLALPAFPTTTIGSFPQTEDVRKARAAHMRGTMSDADYDGFLRQHTAMAIRWQEDIGLDVLVHGEFERNDMVQYFGEQLSGYAFTKQGWVQSYGSRCVRPPIIFGDVSRPHPMTVEWARYAQSQTKKPMKGMLTGPITMLQWSFVRDDLPRADVCRQIALALRDEVCDLERAGIAIIQIDEAAMREGLPLRKRDWKAYLDWAVECFRLASSGVADRTQIHTHMCYSEFNDIIEAIGALDADVISIETARSKMELLEAFAVYHYPNEIGPGVYDIHAPRCPTVDEMTALLKKASERLAPDQIWVNPDCGLKTRKWEEVRPALANMVEAAKRVRQTCR
jgi:5-methyltetrahydropteroyltriglutamate--homocysteine methyltransferase